MKTKNILLLLMFWVAILPSCLIEDEAPTDDYDTTANLAGFDRTRITISGIADGSMYDYDMRVKVEGPTTMDLTSDITLTVEVDPSSTAIAGTHFRIDNPTIVLTKGDNYLGMLKVTMLTEGIVTPLAEAPLLVLKAKSASGDAMVINNGKPLEITMNFACFSSFEGQYAVTTTRDDGASFSMTETIIKTGVEEYYTEGVGIWDPQLNPPNGFTFGNACNVISVPDQGLADMYSNNVYMTKPGSVNPDTGVITIYYSIEFGSGDRQFTAVYTPL